MMNNDWYTQQEVAELLGVSKQTVYMYAKQGKIKKIADPYRNIREVRYQKAEVDALVAQKNAEPVGYKPSEVAKYLGVTVQTIYRYIQEGRIDTHIIPYGDERTRHIIPEKGFQQAKEIIQEQKKKGIQRFEYYDSQLDVALFQKFSSDSISEARIARNKEHEWVFYLPGTGEIISLDEGFKTFCLQPSYPIHQETLPYKGYAQLRVPKEYQRIYELIDYFYRTWGIENVRLREEERIIRFWVKEGEMPFISPIPFEEIELFITDGKWWVRENVLMVLSAYRKTSVELPVSMLETIQEKAKENNMSMSQYIEHILAMFIYKNDMS